jgi:putative ubiquitin-RnfH superfamily antitoxin RatB of RatAB toxin-antitoxin module
MISVRVRVHGLLVAAVPQPDVWVEVSLLPSASVADLIRALSEQLESPLFDAGSCTATIDRAIMAMDHILEDGDRVELYHLFSGG